jgi:hypothetical protein
VRRIRMIPAIAITSRSSVAFGYVGQRLSLPGDARAIHSERARSAELPGRGEKSVEIDLSRSLDANTTGE